MNDLEKQRYQGVNGANPRASKVLYNIIIEYYFSCFILKIYQFIETKRYCKRGCQ